VIEDTGEQRDDTGFLEQLLEQFQEVPLFLRNSFEWLSTSAKISLDDFFWIGGRRDPLHPYLANGLIALVNRRRKTALHFASKPLWQQPIYIILKRDGSYLAACCGAEKRNPRNPPVQPGFSPPSVVPKSPGRGNRRTDRCCREKTAVIVGSVSEQNADDRFLTAPVSFLKTKLN
jgi:hypothetical protein